MTTITFVNHASVIIETGGQRLLFDPWIEGSAFHNGWDLIAPTTFSFEDFADITHIWFSHEHPDHFSPPNIKRISESDRNRITVIFQKTADKKVINFCKDLGFKVRELPEHTWVQMGPWRVMNGKSGFYDSWLMVEADGARILNLNDCQLNDAASLRDVHSLIDKRQVDLLMTQFSYACWIGNAEDKPEREEAAQLELQRLQIQMEAIHPTHVHPFASFVRFSHAENEHLNDSVNTVSDALGCIEQTAAIPIILYPGETWTLGAPHDNAPALQRWQEAYARIPDMPRHHVGATVTIERLMVLADEHLKRLRSKNNRLMLEVLARVSFFPEVGIRLRDVGQVVTFGVRDGLKVADAQPVDIEMSSESLAFLLQFEWGMDTLTVNGRFRATADSFLRVKRAFSVGVLNNTGRALGFGMLADWKFGYRALSRLLNLR